MNAPDPTPVLDLIDAFRRSKAMFAAVSLGIFDLLAEGPAEAGVLASRVGAQTDPLARLLDACTGLGLLTKHGNTYANTPVADRYLVRASPQTLSGYILYSDEVLFRLWANLADAIREGSPRWQQTFRFEGPIFDQFFKSDASMRTFLRGMHGFGQLSSPRVVRAFDLSRFHRIVDLGGATGHLVVAACQAYPSLRGAVFDLPRVIDVARDTIAQARLEDRIELHAGDFFTDQFPQADLYSLARILHDWPEDKVRLLLAKVCRALPPGGGLLIAEKLLDEDKAGPLAANLQSLNMLVCTEGKERSFAEYRQLLHEAGFSDIAGRRTGSPLDAVLAVKN